MARTSLAVLVVLYGSSGVLCFVAALWPMSPDTPTGLLAVLGLVGVVGAGVIWAVGGLRPGPVVNVALLVLSVATAVLAANTVTTAGIVGLGPLMVSLGLYAAHFLPHGVARAQVAVALGLTTGGAALSDVRGYLNGWVVVIVATLIVTEVQAVTIRRLRDLAERDPLTGLANRRAWLRATDVAVAAAERQGSPVTVALIDLDSFTEVNDSEGHVAGDILLQELARAWGTTVRSSDVLARYGGDEFVLLLHGTDAAGARQLLDRMREVHRAPWSSGIAVWQPGDTSADLARRADEALYEEKASGPAVPEGPRSPGGGT